MKLYHGTARVPLATVLREGLRPRGKAPGNFQHSVPSNPDAVYLSYCYAPWFIWTSRHDIRARTGLLIEVDTDKLQQLSLYPDEDCLEQVGRGRDDIRGDMRARTLWYRDHIHQWIGNDEKGAPFWHTSIKALGTCCYYGAIPPQAITRIAKINLKKNTRMFWDFDCSVSTISRRITGDMYHWRTRCIFGDSPDNHFDDRFGTWQIQVNDVEVLTLDNGKIVARERLTRQRERTTWEDDAEKNILAAMVQQSAK